MSFNGARPKERNCLRSKKYGNSDDQKRKNKRTTEEGKFCYNVYQTMLALFQTILLFNVLSKIILNFVHE